ncbi:hypothetical protein D0Y65_048022, partial [Glycine soja]
MALKQAPSLGFKAYAKQVKANAIALGNSMMGKEAEYGPKSDLLDQEFMLKGKWYQQKDVEGCTNWVKCLYNNGCRANASEAAIILLPSNIMVFALDFLGSGISRGEHVTLGWNKKDDLKVVVNDLRDDGNVSLIGLWSHSMGAVT